MLCSTGMSSVRNTTEHKLFFLRSLCVERLSISVTDTRDTSSSRTQRIILAPIPEVSAQDPVQGGTFRRHSMAEQSQKPHTWSMNRSWCSNTPFRGTALVASSHHSSLLSAASQAHNGLGANPSVHSHKLQKWQSPQGLGFPRHLHHLVFPSF